MLSPIKPFMFESSVMVILASSISPSNTIKYPKLTANELKLCTFLRLNLSTKEIAQLMNISLRGVELSRYRLRKKLELPTETSLFEFFNSI